MRLPLLQPRRLAFQLALDDAHQIVFVLVGVLVRLPLRAQAVDQLPRHAQFRRTNLALLRELEVVEIGQFVGEAHHRQHQRVADGFDRGQVLGVAEDDLRDPDLAGLADRFPDQRVGAVGPLARLQVVGRLEVALIDVLGIDEVEDVDGLGLLEGGRLEVVLGQDDELPLLVLVALDEILPADRLAFGLADALVVHRRLVFRVQQPESGTVIARRAVQLDRDVHQPERNRALPHRPCHESIPHP